MILLDTNVVSEPLRPQPERKVIAWLENQLIENLYLSAITVAELRLGVALLADGKKKALLHQRLEAEVFPLFKQRILAFDSQTATMYAQIRAAAKSCGQAIASADAYIAATAKQYRLAVASRDSTPFLASGLQVINPWLD